MDYLDPKKQFQHTVILFVGYVLIGVAILIAAVVLKYQAEGFGLGKDGTVIQNGLVFFSSHPSAASIYVNNQLEKPRTNTRLALPAATYKVRLERPGYQNWERTINLEGGQVAHYDYPLLIPKTLASTKLLSFDAAPTLSTQSPDHRWLLVARPTSYTSFELFDLKLKDPTKNSTTITLSSDVVSKAVGAQSWQLIQWADDNQHLVLQHVYDNTSEYILVDRQNPLQSLNLSKTLSATPTKLSLIDRKYDKYYLYDATSQTLSKANLKDPTATTVLNNVLAYQSYSDNVLLYATASGAPAGKVLVRLQDGDKSYTLRTLSGNTTYLLDITTYSGNFYAALGASSENKVYIYKDPAKQLSSGKLKAPVPTQVLHVDAPNYLSFSSSAQYIMTENGNQFGIYDIENKHGYNYITSFPLDAPQTHATWMDGNRLSYVTGGKQLIFDYDYLNQRLLGSALPALGQFFSPDNKYVYTLASSGAAGGQASLLQTALLIPTEL